MELFAAGRAGNALGAMTLSSRADKERVNSSTGVYCHPNHHAANYSNNSVMYLVYVHVDLAF
jgi:hypothetical protein